jgi:hypothetical protein
MSKVYRLLLGGLLVSAGLNCLAINSVHAQPRNRGRGLVLKRNTSKLRGEYLNIIRMFRRKKCRGDLGSTTFWLRRAERLGKELGRRPLPPGFKARVLAGGWRRDMHRGLQRASASLRRGNLHGASLGLKRAIRGVQALHMTGDQLKGELARYRIRPGDIARFTDYKLQPK